MAEWKEAISVCNVDSLPKRLSGPPTTPHRIPSGNVLNINLNSSSPGRYGSNFSSVFSKLILQNDILSFFCKIGLCEHHKIPLVKSLHWFRKWLGAIRQQAITWSNVVLDLCHHMASLAHNELTSTLTMHLKIILEWATYPSGQWVNKSTSSHLKPVRCYDTKYLINSLDLQKYLHAGKPPLV